MLHKDPGNHLLFMRAFGLTGFYLCNRKSFHTTGIKITEIGVKKGFLAFFFIPTDDFLRDFSMKKDGFLQGFHTKRKVLRRYGMNVSNEKSYLGKTYVPRQLLYLKYIILS